MLEFDDIQHILLTRVPALTGRYEFLSFRNAAGGRAWLSAIARQGAVGRGDPGFDRPGQSLGDGRLHVERPARTGLWTKFRWQLFPKSSSKAWSPARRCSATPETNHPENWVGGLARPDLHAIAILFARDAAERERSQAEHDKLVARCEGVEVLSTLDLDATPPFDYAHDHFGYRDRLSQPVIEGSGEIPTPGSGAPLKPGEFILGYPDERRPTLSNCRNPKFCPATAATWLIAAWRSMWASFATSCASTVKLPRSRNCMAAKLMGRWRSGAPLVLAPDKDDPALGADPQRNNDFNYKEMDPHGYAVPLGSHMRRMNPRDTAANMNRRRMIRRGATYGPHLPEDAPEDGAERGIAAFVICASLIRQYEFAQNVWVNDRNFHELGNERDPIIGNHDGTFEFKIPTRPIRKKITGLPAFTTVRGGAYFFLPGIKALRYLSTLPDGRPA